MTGETDRDLLGDPMTPAERRADQADVNTLMATTLEDWAELNPCTCREDAHPCRCGDGG